MTYVIQTKPAKRWKAIPGIEVSGKEEAEALASDFAEANGVPARAVPKRKAKDDPPEEVEEAIEATPLEVLQAQARLGDHLLARHLDTDASIAGADRWQPGESILSRRVFRDQEGDGTFSVLFDQEDPLLALASGEF